MGVGRVITFGLPPLTLDSIEAAKAKNPKARKPTRRTSVKAYVEAEGQIRTYQPVKPVKPKARKTTRKPKTERVPRTRAGGEWTEASFWSFLRSGLRRMSQRWPPAVRLIWLKHRRPNQSANRRLKWEFNCSMCNGWYKRAGMAADHITQCGALSSWEDLPRFASRLFCEVEDLRILCEECHKVRHQPEDK